MKKHEKLMREKIPQMETCAILDLYDFIVSSWSSHEVDDSDEPIGFLLSQLIMELKKRGVFYEQ